MHTRGMLKDLWLHAAVLFSAFAVDLVALLSPSGSSIAIRVFLIVAQVGVALYRFYEFTQRPPPSSLEQLRETQPRLVASLDVVALGVLVAVDVLTLTSGGAPSVAVFLSALGGLLHYRLTLIAADARFAVVFHDEAKFHHLSRKASRLHWALVLLRVAGLVSTFLWSAIGIVVAVHDDALNVFSVVAFGVSALVYSLGVVFFWLSLRMPDDNVVVTTSSTGIPALFLQ